MNWDLYKSKKQAVINLRNSAVKDLIKSGRAADRGNFEAAEEYLACVRETQEKVCRMEFELSNIRKGAK